MGLWISILVRALDAVADALERIVRFIDAEVVEDVEREMQTERVTALCERAGLYQEHVDKALYIADKYGVSDEEAVHVVAVLTLWNVDVEEFCNGDVSLMEKIRDMNGKGDQ